MPETEPGDPEYYERTKDGEPSKWLPAAIALAGEGRDALDLGCGAGRDTKFLLERGFRVTAVDYDPETAPYLARLPHQECLMHVVSRFADFDFGVGKYNLVNAQFSLPYTHRDTFEMVFGRMEASLKPGGVFVGQFFGMNQEWRKSVKSTTSFHTKEEVGGFFGKFEIKRLIEREYDDVLHDGTPMHWHVFHILAKKR